MKNTNKNLSKRLGLTRVKALLKRKGKKNSTCRLHGGFLDNLGQKVTCKTNNYEGIMVHAINY